MSKKSKFQIKVRADDEEDSFAILSVTHNGYQWQNFLFEHPDQLRELVRQVAYFLRAKP